MTSKRFTFIQATPIYNRAQDQLYVLQKKTSTIDVFTAVLFEDVVPGVSEEATLIFGMFEIKQKPPELLNSVNLSTAYISTLINQPHPHASVMQGFIASSSRRRTTGSLTTNTALASVTS
ncbi:hypothetical protein F2Q70_00017200 [Brassica cretica]|uniref:Uncharacterized protein n=1 Tax=Brassica cretica TaxID=69181 RepID=A0A8S9HXE2_BRACR|nr:hypothetical protein F2Q70_00017200 [Brassica cretica]KAF2597127.1 hypothetical protein F2Q68_00010146 [Brassica cretica]